MRNFAAEAKASLSLEDVDFLKSLPKAELHAHLNGCIPLECLQTLAAKRAESRLQSQSSNVDREAESVNINADDAISKGLQVLDQGVTLDEIHEFFELFPAIYALTSTPETLSIATRAVLEQFLDAGWTGPEDPPQCTYLELRTTPRQNEHMTRLQYLEAVLEEVERYDEDKCALIASVDRRMDSKTMLECIEAAATLKAQGRRIVGIDLCGTPTIGDPNDFLPIFQTAREKGLKLTLHIAETKANTKEDTLTLLAAQPTRLGHATFLDKEACDIVLQRRLAIEICLSSNLLCKTAESLAAHHINYWMEHDIPLAICTDDTLVFRNTLVEEYALLMAKPPFGLGLSRDAISRLASMSIQARFR